MKFNKKYETLLTTDTAGMMDYWSSVTYKFPKGVLTFKHKIDTDLYAMARAKTQVLNSLGGKGYHTNRDIVAGLLVRG